MLETKTSDDTEFWSFVWYLKYTDSPRLYHFSHRGSLTSFHKLGFLRAKKGFLRTEKKQETFNVTNLCIFHYGASK